jgi:predicted nuclease of predicted toxin-antitoxin system
MHVDDVGLSGAPDATIAAYARRENYVLCTKDTDFAIGSDLYNAATGPCVVLIRLGNVPTSIIESALRAHAEMLEYKVQRQPFNHEIG